ncbi:MAG: ComEC/Rec2 family competence protein, partial [Rhodothermales bacterium]|nr:ComEC/Rec2 family competence protein [Rhodothermales bacterium]
MCSGRNRWPYSPALLLAGALAAGIWWSDRLTDALPAYGYATIVVVALLYASRRPTAGDPTAPLVRFVVACILVGTAGSLRHEGNLTIASERDEVGLGWDREELLLMGRVATTSPTRYGSFRLLLRPTYDLTRGRGGATVLAYAELKVVPVAGSVVAFHARRMPWPDPRNPGEFDYGRFLSRRGVDALVQATDTVRVMQEAAGVELWTSRLRTDVEATLEKYVPSFESRSILRALVLGDRSQIDPTLYESFVATGLVHLLAVSGLHVMIVGLVLFRLAGPLLLRTGLPWLAAEGLRVTMTLAILSVYAVLAGLPTSVVRAIIMTAFLLVGPLLRRSTVSLNSLGAACLLILWMKPHSLFEAGFQLSVAAV